MSYLNSLTRLLAEENLIIIEGNFKTASIDIDNRVVRVPSHYNQNEHVQILFRAHEVGHALYTPFDSIHSMLETNKKYARVLFPYINICEDVRIEKMIQMKFPGLRKDFYLGYQTLIEMKLFGNKFYDGHKNNQHFADRLNYYFKVGAERSGVVFTPIEKQIVDLVDSTITFDDVVHAAKVLYEYCKEQHMEMEQKNGMKSNKSGENNSQDGEGGESQDGEGGESQDDDESQESRGRFGGGDSEESQESQESEEDGESEGGSGEGDPEDGEEGQDGESGGDGDDSEESEDNNGKGGSGDGGSEKETKEPQESDKSKETDKKKFERYSKTAKTKNYKNENDFVPEPETFEEKENASSSLARAVNSTCLSPKPIPYKKFISYKDFI